ncbi:NUDIX hydrolase, partial [Streptomyces sp. RSD-27]
AQQRRIFHHIGRLAAAVHRSAPPGPATAVHSGPWERHLDAALPHLAPGDEEFVRAAAARAARLPAPHTVPTHGDLQLRNLRWDEAGGTLHVIDFERGEYGPAVRDFVRLSDAWHGRPDLYDALTAGYGRPLTAVEQEQLAVLSVLDAVSGIRYGAAHTDPELVERGRRTLARHRTTSRP